MVFDRIDEIERQLLAGEDSLAEFKRVELGQQGVRSPNSEDVAGELCAFANAEGGALFLGVDDDGAVRGIPGERLRVVEEWVVNIARGRCDPPLVPLVRSVVLPDPDGSDRHVLVVEVRRSLFAHRIAGGRWYVRVGSSKRDLSSSELPRLLQQRAHPFAFDEAVVSAATADDLDAKAVDVQARPTRRLDRDRLLQNLQILQDSEGVLRPTVAGLLAFGRDPAEHLPRAYVHAAVYRGTARTSDDLVSSEDIRGSVDRQVDGAMAFVDRFMLTPARKSVGRADFPQFDLEAVHEAVVNAIAHRDYSIAGARIRLLLYADRLELSSPGALPNTLTVETMRYRQYTRNQLLVSFLSRMTSRRTQRAFIEERGEGVQLIIDRSERLAHREPSYEVHGDELLLTIWAHVPAAAPRRSTGAAAGHHTGGCANAGIGSPAHAGQQLPDRGSPTRFGVLLPRNDKSVAGSLSALRGGRRDCLRRAHGATRAVLAGRADGAGRLARRPPRAASVDQQSSRR